MFEWYSNVDPQHNALAAAIGAFLLFVVQKLFPALNQWLGIKSPSNPAPVEPVPTPAPAVPTPVLPLPVLPALPDLGKRPGVEVLLRALSVVALITPNRIDDLALSLARRLLSENKIPETHFNLPPEETPR